MVGVVVALDRMERMPTVGEMEGKKEEEEKEEEEKEEEEKEEEEEEEEGGDENKGENDDDEREGAGTREGRRKGRRSAVQELRRTLGVPVLAVLTLDDLIGFAGGSGSARVGPGGEEMERLKAYRERYIARE